MSAVVQFSCPIIILPTFLRPESTITDCVSAIYCVRPRPCHNIVQELCESRGGRPGLSVLTSLLVSLDVKLY